MIKIEFDLFKLNNPKLDIGNKSWICFKGKNLHKIINEIKKEIIKKRNLNSTQQLAYFISNKLNIKSWTAEQVLFNHKKWIPIPIIQELIKLSNNPKKYYNEIIKNTSYLKCNSATSKQIKAVKKLNIILCKITGAHAADGNISPRIVIDIKNSEKSEVIIKKIKKYCKNITIINTSGKIRVKIKSKNPSPILSKIKQEKDISIFIGNQINITEGYFYTAKSYQKWIKKCFNLNVKLKPHGQKKAWRIDFDNKIICRYLTEFFKFPNGKKTYIVREPNIIKKSSLKFRKAFLVGLMSFEGCVYSKRNNIEFISISKNLTKDVGEILNKLEIPTKTRKDNYNRWDCRSSKLNKIQLKKAMKLFEPNTEKWYKLYEKLNGFNIKYKNIKQTKELLKHTYPNNAINKIDVVNLFSIILNKKKIPYQLLKQKLNVHESTLTNYLRILKDCNIVYTKNKPTNIILNQNREEWVLPSEIYKNARL